VLSENKTKCDFDLNSRDSCSCSHIFHSSVT